MKVKFFCNHFSLAMFSSQKGQVTKIRKTDKKKNNRTIKKTKPKFVSVFFIFYFLNTSITSFLFSPASFVNKSTFKFI